MSDKLSFLGGEQPAEVEVLSAVQSEPEAQAPETAQESPARDEDGRRFAAKAVETPSEAPAAPQAAPEPKPVRETPPVDLAPIAALMDERDKRQAAQAEAQRLAKELEALKAVAPEPPREITPDEKVQLALYQQNLRASRRFAEREYGKDTIQTVHEWAAAKCDADPFFNSQMIASEDPYENAYQAYNREQIIAQVKPDDFAAFKAWQAAQAQAAAQTPTHQPTPTPAPAPPPRSLAHAPNAGGAGAQAEIPMGPGAAFASAITR